MKPIPRMCLIPFLEKKLSLFIPILEIQCFRINVFMKNEAGKLNPT